MDKSKRILSIILSIFMLFSIVNPASLVAADETKTVESNEIVGKKVGDKEVFTFDLSKLIKKESGARMSLKAMSARAPRRVPGQNDTTVNIKTTGLNGGEFNWEALPNKQFKLIAKWETTDGQKHKKEIGKITEAGTTTYNVGWPVDGTMTGNASIETDYYQNIEVRVVDIYVSSTGGAGKLVFDITLKELAESRAKVEYVDPYGRPLTDTNDYPASTDKMPKVTADELTDVEIELPKKDKQINMRSSDDIEDNELNEAANGLTYKVDNKTTSNTVTIGEKEYKLNISRQSAKEIATIKMIYQKDVIVPPADGDGNPVKPADGYVRLIFDANENKADGITGTHTAGDYAGKQKSYIDVKQGVQYDNANLQAAIKALSTTGTKEVNGETKTYAQDAKNPWTPEVPTDTTAVVQATYNAKYTKSKADQVTELGGLKAKDIAVWVGDQITWANGVEAKDAAKKAEIDALLQGATVTDQSNRNSDAKGEYKGDLLVTFDDNSTLEVKDQMLYVYENGDEKPVDPNKPVPTDAATVTFTKDDASIKAEGWDTVKPIIVKKGTKVPAAKFPNAEAKEGYKSVTWTPAKDTVVNADQEFKASASKEGKPTVKYPDPTIEKGDTETVTPDVKDKDGKPVDKDKVGNPEITNKDELPKDITVTPKDNGEVEIKVPDDYNGPKDITIKVTVPVDGEKVETEIKVTIKDKYVPVPTPEKSDKPIINPIYDSDDYVTGEGVPGATVEVRFPDGTIERVIVDGDGRWVAPVPYPLYDEEIVEARQIEFGKEPSDWVAERVRYDDEYWRERDRRDRDDNKEDTKKPSKVEPRWTPPALNARDHFSYIKGYGNNIFGPNRTITRAEVAMIFARLSVNQSTGGAPQFKDVKAGDWYKTAVDIMARQGVIKGYEDGTFKPNQPITRREFAAIAARYAGNLDTWKTFRDVPPTDWAYKLINRVAGAGWINGYEDGTFRPNNNITRAEVVAIVNRMLNRKADAKYVDNNLMRTKGAFVDNMRSAWYYYDIYEAAFGHSYERLDNGVDEKWNRVTGQAFEIRER